MARKVLKIIFNVHNRRSTTAAQKSIEMVESLKKCAPNNEYEILCTSDKNKLIIKKELLNGISIIQFPDLLWGRLRQGIDLYNSFLRICYLLKNSNFTILHSIDARPVIFFSSIFAKFFLKKHLVLAWWDFSGKGGISEQRFGKLYSKTFGLIEYNLDAILRKVSDANLVVSLGMFEKIMKMNPKALNYWIRVGASQSDVSLDFNFSNLEKFNYIFYCGALSKSEEKFIIDTADYIKNKNIKLVVAGTDIPNNTPHLTNFGFVKDFNDILSLIRYARFCILPFKNNTHNNLRWPSKMSDYCRLGKMVVSTPLDQINKIDEKFYLLSSHHSVKDFGNTLINAFQFSNKEIEQFEKQSLLFFENELSNDKISLRINNIYKKLA